MMSDHELIMSGDFAELRGRYRGYVYRLASAFANNHPAMAHELTERTFRMVASEPFVGEHAFKDGQPTVRQFITQLLVAQWSEIIKRQRTDNLKANSLTPYDADSSQIDLDPDTGLGREV
jgi:hypothetical protein